jgi:hypothetical protein
MLPFAANNSGAKARALAHATVGEVGDIVGVADIDSKVSLASTRVGEAKVRPKKRSMAMTAVLVYMFAAWGGISRWSGQDVWLM